MSENVRPVSWSTEVTDWAHETFGDPTIERAADRAYEEISELYDAIDVASFDGNTDNLKHIAKEASDVAITLCRLTQLLGFDLATVIQETMRVNIHERRWHTAGDGTGYHCKHEPNDEACSFRNQFRAVLPGTGDQPGDGAERDGCPSTQRSTSEDR